MPEPIKSEEDVNREHSLCLFNVPGITILNRCDNCPGATRSPLQHRRCPLDAAQPNILRIDSESRIKSSASSSSRAAESLSVGALSLADSTVDVGSKRKVGQSAEFYLKNKSPAPFEDFLDPYPNKRLNQLMRISQEIHEEAAGSASSSMIPAVIPGFDLNKTGVHAFPHDMEIDRTQIMRP